MCSSDLDILVGSPTLRTTGLKAFFADPSALMLPDDPDAEEESHEANPEYIDRSLFVDPPSANAGPVDSTEPHHSVVLNKDFPLYGELVQLVAEYKTLWLPLDPTKPINHPGAVFDLTLRDGFSTTMQNFHRGICLRTLKHGCERNLTRFWLLVLLSHVIVRLHTRLSLLPSRSCACAWIIPSG